MTDAAPAILEVTDLSKSFVDHRLTGGGSTIRAVDGVSFDVRQGEILVVVGESGCGKSTVARLVSRLIAPDDGTIRFDGTDLTALKGGRLRRSRAAFQMVFQDPFGSFNPRRTMLSALTKPLAIHGMGNRAERRDRAMEMLEAVRLVPATRFADRYPHELSGGQLQRAAIARALMTEPRLLIADEPVASLDVSVQAQVLSLLMEIRERLDLSMIFITHDLGVVRSIADRVVVMYLGKIVDFGPTAEVMDDPSHPYTRALIDAAPSFDRETSANRVLLQGSIPSAANPPSGCHFHPRCPMAQIGECTTVEPVLAPVSSTHSVACHLAGPVQS